MAFLKEAAKLIACGTALVVGASCTGLGTGEFVASSESGESLFDSKLYLDEFGLSVTPRSLLMDLLHEDLLTSRGIRELTALSVGTAGVATLVSGMAGVALMRRRT